MRFLSLLLLVFSLSIFTACDSHDHDHHGHDHDHDHDHDHKDGEHAHTAPHGGTLVKVGDHFAMIELVFDSANGKLDLYFLDGEAEKAQKPETMPTKITAELADKTRVDIALKGVASSVTGETETSTSHLSGQADALKKQSKFQVTFASFSIKGKKFESLSAPFPEGNDKDHDHKEGDHDDKDGDHDEKSKDKAPDSKPSK